VTQCDVSRLGALERQAVAWGGTVSLAFYVALDEATATVAEQLQVRTPYSLSIHGGDRLW
jgi:hypothetical protein